MNDTFKALARLAVTHKMFPNGMDDIEPLIEENMILSHVGRIMHFISGPNTLLTSERGLADSFPPYLKDVEKIERSLKQYLSGCLEIVKASRFPGLKIIVIDNINRLMPVGGDIKIAFENLVNIIVNKNREDYTSPELMVYFTMYMIHESMKWYLFQGNEQGLKGYISEYIWEQVNRLNFD